MPLLGESQRESPWSSAVLRTRIEDAESRTRYEAGSPNAVEITAYESGLYLGSQKSEGKSKGFAVVLGMTPELLTLALERFEQVVAFDRNAEAIALYQEWLPERSRHRATLLCADWFEIPALLTEAPDAILGDGIFGNLPDRDTHGRLLRQLLELLAPGAPLVVRKALIPRGFDAEAERLEHILERHRQGELDASEFGFAARILGHYEMSYAPESHLLHNARSFTSCEAQYRRGLLKQSEWAAIRRYFFEGDNCILPQDIWEEELTRAGFDFVQHRCEGRDWYRYYPVYACRRAAGRPRTRRASREMSNTPIVRAGRSRGSGI